MTQNQFYSLSSMLMTRHSVFALLVLVSIVTPIQAQSSNVQSIGKESLSHLNGIEVVVEDVREALRRNGMSGSAIKTDVELALREAGIEVFTEEESSQTDSEAYLYVRVTAMQGSGPASSLIAYSINVTVNQKVTLTTGQPQQAQTYSTPGSTGLAGKQRLRFLEKSLMNEVEAFINDWLSTHRE